MARDLKRVARIGSLAALVAAGAVGAFAFRKPSTPTAALAFACTPGTDDVYSLSYESEGTLADPTLGIGGASDAPPMRVVAKVKSAMHVTCVANDSDGQTLAVRFDDAQGGLEVSGGEGSGDAATLLRGTTFVSRDGHGRTGGVRFDAAMNESGRVLVRDILANVQVTGPADGAPVAWRVREEDANGPYEAAYRITGEERGIVALEKTRSAPTSRMRDDQRRPRAEAGAGNVASYRVRRTNGHLEAASVNGTTTLVVGTRTVGKTSTRLDARWQRADEVARQDLAVAQREGTASDLGAHDVDARLEERMMRAELGTDTWTTVTARLDEAAHRTKTFLQLKALFLLEPERCAEARRELGRLSDPHAQRFGLLAGALASAGTPDAQHALVGAAMDAADRPNAQRTLVATTGLLTKAPTGEVLDSLQSMAGDESSSQEMRGTARLALGSLARQSAESDPARAAALLGGEITSLQSARTSDEKILALLAIGNVGSLDALATVRDALGDEDPRVRTAAVSALRLLDSTEAEALLVDRLGHDDAASVRAEAIRSLALRSASEETLDLVARAAQRDVDENVRLQAVAFVGEDLAVAPAMANVLEGVSTGDRAQAVRNAAKLALLRWKSHG